MKKYFKVDGSSLVFKVTKNANGIWISVAGLTNPFSAWKSDVQNAALEALMLRK